MLEKNDKTELQNMLQVDDLDSVDVGNGTLFGSAVLRKAGEERLTLVISTGGSGMTAIDTAMRIADQKLTVDYKKFVKFIVVDSDTAQINNRRKKGVTTINISTAGAQERFADKDKNGNDNRSIFFRSIMPQNYNIKMIDPNGAAQDRMTGLIKFLDQNENGDTNYEKFREMISDLFDGEWKAYGDKPVDIMILSGLGGGNGSGTFINLAVAAREACPAERSVRVYGYLMLPDTAKKFYTTNKERIAMYRNGFAALKELESYMSMGFNMDSKATFRMSENTEVVVSAGRTIFDYPILISGDYDDAVEMIGETIVNLIADSQGEFDQNSFYSNIITARQLCFLKESVSDKGILKVNTFPEDSHTYSGIGYAHASIPEKIVIPNIVGKVCRKLYVKDNSDVQNTAFCTQTQHLSSHDFEQQIRRLLGVESSILLNKDALWDIIYEDIEASVEFKENKWDVGYSELVDGEFTQYIEGFEKETVRQKAIDKMIEKLKNRFEGFKVVAESIMKTFGPRALEYLYTGEGNMDSVGKREDFSNICLKTMISTVTEKIENLANKSVKYPGKLEPVRGIAGRVKEKITNSKVNDWKDEVDDAVHNDVYHGVAKGIKGESGSWKTDYAKRVEAFVSDCSCFADIIEIMMDYYTGVGKCLDAADFEEFANTTGERNGVNLCSNSKMYEWVKAQVSRKVNGVPVQDVKEELINDFMAHTECWVNGNTGEARKHFDEIMSKCCKLGKYTDVSDGLGLSITDYFDEILKGVTNAKAQQIIINNEVRDIMQKLEQCSKPSIKVLPNSTYTVNRMILIPKSLSLGQYSSIVKTAFMDNINIKGAGTKGVKWSSVADTIICYTTSVGHALASLQDLPKWEECYESSMNDTTHTCNGQYHNDYTEDEYKDGVTQEEKQLFSTGLSWVHHPSINIAAYENEFDSDKNTMEARYRKNEFDKKIEYALKEKIIECVEDNNKYRYYLNVIPKSWDNIDISEYTGEKGKELFDFLAALNPAQSTEIYRKPIILTGSAFFEDGFDFTQIIAVAGWKEAQVAKEHRAYMKRIMRKNTWLYKELEETIRRYKEIIKVLEEKWETEQRNKKAKIFCELYLYHVINCENKILWTVKGDRRNNTKEIIQLNAKAKARMSGFDEKLNKDNLIIPIVYRKFCEMLGQKAITMEALENMKESVLSTVDDEEFEEMLQERLEGLKGEVQKYIDIIDTRNPIKDMRERYGLDKGMSNEIEDICEFYEVAQNTIENFI